MTRKQWTGLIASLIVGAIVGFGVAYFGGPPWASAGFAAVAYLVVVGR